MATKKKGIRGGVWTEDSGVPVPQNPEGAKAREEAPEGYRRGGSVGSASKRADGIAQRGKTRGTTIAMCGGGMSKRK